jgi:hypothetical protein
MTHSESGRLTWLPVRPFEPQTIFLTPNPTHLLVYTPQAAMAPVSETASGLQPTGSPTAAAAVLQRMREALPPAAPLLLIISTAG